jgi:endonuclease/exonuclease/phosphatase (EEP) superfamily protein YafD
MPESIEQWLWLIISVLFIAFAFLVIVVVFHSPIVWLCLGLLVAIMFLYPIVRNLPTTVNLRRQRRAQEQQEWLLSVNNQQQLSTPKSKQQRLSAPKGKQQQLMPETQQSSLDEPNVQKYIPPGLPPELFL